ncbi:protein-L-isoaspartate(D-aspartate) O-methyltransferase [Halomonas cerina]|uniref:Protein-L-isoaspartate O-methyltransferase n=1 Tax=Halomonas cerina TaxID=447424 RepID=A0A839V0N5_9GAMM|nr:protein-L-isoaspartate(D-aspartate) O-methyltransferase [Halomonas cerina]MBB3188892.1 protein-L-isoaspartate(D-aspartate) O-methyltransferase [Halomonas cerina]
MTRQRAMIVRQGAVLGLSLCWACLAASAATAQTPRVLLQAERDAAAPSRPAFGDGAYAERRERMVRDQVAGEGVTDAAVLDAMRRVPRHRFVPHLDPLRAYRDAPQPIGHGQTISQPYIVGFMTERLGLDPDDRVLEVGTGSAYQAAILAEIVEDVVTLEIIAPLAERAAERLATLGYTNVTVLHGDGYYGYPPRAPYDAIIVTAAASHVPPPLLEQLRPDGRMVIPVGQMGWIQNLLLLEKNPEGEVSSRNLATVRFVPLTRGH